MLVYPLGIMHQSDSLPPLLRGWGIAGILNFLFVKPGYMSSNAGTFLWLSAQVPAGNSETSPASSGMKPKAALFHVTAGTMLRSKYGT